MVEFRGFKVGSDFCRLVAEKINKNERKNKAEIITDIDCGKTSEFWLQLGEEDDARPPDPFEVLKIWQYLYENVLISMIDMRYTSISKLLLTFKWWHGVGIPAF